MLTWEWPWQEIGWRFLRQSRDIHLVAVWADGLMSLGLPGFAVTMLAMSIRRRRFADMLIGLAAPVVMLSYVLVATEFPPLSATLLMNLYLLVTGIGLVIQGARGGRLGVFNAGMAVFSALVAARFFDSGFSFIAKGLVFIALGAVFLVCNIILVHRSKEHRDE